MKVVIGIVLISLVILGLIAYMILMLNAREMIFCGDLKNENGTNAQITRVYTTDLNEEIEITIADMRTGNYEAAITRFEGRIGSTNLSEVCRGFIQMIRGDDTSVYWETLAIRFSELQKQYLRNIALKIPPKVHRLSFFLMMSMMLLYVVVLGWELLSNMGVLFG
mgnify:CR=1 FL=1